MLRLARNQTTGRTGQGVLRLGVLLVAVLLVVAARQRLNQPETQQAIGRVLASGQAGVAEVVELGPVAIPESLLDTIEDNTFFRGVEQPAWFAMIAAVAEGQPTPGPRVGYSQLVGQPSVYRGRRVTLSGKLRRIEQVEPAPNDQGIERLWRVTLQPLGGGVWPLTVYTLEQPDDSLLEDDVAAKGCFFKNLSYRWSEGVGLTPVVIARRVEATHPVETASSAGSTEPSAEAEFAPPLEGSIGRALLVDLGVDTATLDAVKDRLPFAADESQAFYGVLRSTEATPATQLVRLARVGLPGWVERQAAALGGSAREQQTLAAVRREAGRSRYSVAPLFGDGARQRGELIVFDTIVRRAVRVEADPSEATGGHYFELEAFPEDSQNLPVVFCVRELPAGFPRGESVRVPARLAGFFFKQWAYRTQKISKRSPREQRRQFAPLLIGRAPIVLRVEESPRGPGAWVGGIGAGLLTLLLVAMWRLGRRDRRYADQTLRRLRRLDDTDFNRLS